MEDKQIVDLYWARSETAIAETEKKYGRYCHYIAYQKIFAWLFRVCRSVRHRAFRLENGIDDPLLRPLQ